VWDLDVLARDDGCVRVAALHSAVPHQVVVGEFAEWHTGLRLLFFLLLLLDGLAVLLLRLDDFGGCCEGIIRTH
jgi:hypothetical protein